MTERSSTPGHDEALKLARALIEWADNGPGSTPGDEIPEMQAIRDNTLKVCRAFVVQSETVARQDIPEGRGSLPAGALERGSPLDAARGVNPGGAAPGGVSERCDDKEHADTSCTKPGRSLKNATLEELEQANALPSETPRTLAFYQSLDGGSVFEHLSKALDFARQLERELTVARSAVAARTYWLIERGSPCEWWAGTDTAKHWTSDVSKVHPLLKFQTREQAQGEADRIKYWPTVIGSELRVTEHIDCAGPDLVVPSASAALRERDLAMMVRRLAARIRLRSRTGPHATPDMALSESAMDFLKRLGLEGSVTRDDEPRLEQSNSPDRSSAK